MNQRFDNFLSNLTYAQSYAIRSQFGGNLYGPTNFKNQAAWLNYYYKNPAQILAPPKKPEVEDEEEEDDDDDVEDEDDVDEWYPEDSHDENTAMALQGITCGDWITKPTASVEKFREWRDLFQSTSKYTGDQALLSLLYQCAIWKNNATEKFNGTFRNIETKNPLLIVNTQYDPVTPLISAKATRDSFARSKLLVSSGGGVSNMGLTFYTSTDILQHCSTAQPSKELNKAIRQYFADASFPDVDQIYEPDRRNYFIPESRNTTTTPRVNATTTGKNKRSIALADLFKNTPVIVKRQIVIPAGCVKKNSTSSSSTMSWSSRNTSTASIGSGYGDDQGDRSTPSAGYGGHSVSASTRSAGYGDNSDGYFTRSAGYGDSQGRVSTRSPGYGGYPGGSPSSAYPPVRTPVYGGYGGYSDSNSSPNKPSAASTPMVSPPPSIYVPITKTITETDCETITKCSGSSNCQIGSVITKTSVRTTVMTVPATSSTKTITETSRETITQCSGGYDCQLGTIITKTSVRTTVITVPATPSTPTATGKVPASSAPGQVYSVPQNTNKPSSVPASPPSVNSQVYGTPSKASVSVPVYQPPQSSVPAVIPSSVSRGGNSIATDAYTKPTQASWTGVVYNGTKSNVTPTGWVPAQFTGAASSYRAAISFVSVIVAILSLCFVM